MDQKILILITACIISIVLYFALDTLVNAPPETPKEEIKENALECTADLDCGLTGFTGSYECRSESVYGEYMIQTCVKIDEKTSKCARIKSMELVETCVSPEVCIIESSECGLKHTTTITPTTFRTIEIVENTRIMPTTTLDLSKEVSCRQNSSCGIDHYGKPYCASSGHSMRDYITYQCLNPGTYASKCAREKKTFLVDYCGYGEACLRGECVDKTRLNEYCLREDCCATDFDLCGNYSVQFLPFPVVGKYNNSFVEDHNTTIYI